MHCLKKIYMNINDWTDNFKGINAFYFKQLRLFRFSSPKFLFPKPWRRSIKVSRTGIRRFSFFAHFPDRIRICLYWLLNWRKCGFTASAAFNITPFQKLWRDQDKLESLGAVRLQSFMTDHNRCGWLYFRNGTRLLYLIYPWQTKGVFGKRSLN